MPLCPSCVRPLKTIRRREGIYFLCDQVKEMERRLVEDPTPDAAWKTIPALFGLPVELDKPSFSRWPLVTWTLAGLIVIASLLSFANLKPTIEQFGFVPQHAWRDGGVTVFTSFFLHAGVFHLVG